MFVAPGGAAHPRLHPIWAVRKYDAAMGIAKLWTTKDIAARLEVSSETVRVLSHRPGFPEPAGQVGHIRVWSADDVERWISEHRPDKASE